MSTYRKVMSDTQKVPLLMALKSNAPAVFWIVWKSTTCGEMGRVRNGGRAGAHPERRVNGYFRWALQRRIRDHSKSLSGNGGNP